MRFWTVRFWITHYWDQKHPILFFIFCIIVVLGYQETSCPPWGRYHTKSKSQWTFMWDEWVVEGKQQLKSHKKALCWVFAPRRLEMLSGGAETSCLAQDGSERREQELGWCPWSNPPSKHVLPLLPTSRLLFFQDWCFQIQVNCIPTTESAAKKAHITKAVTRRVSKGCGFPDHSVS